MEKKKADRLIRISFGVAGLMVLVGIFFRIQNYTYGRLLTITGLSLMLIVLAIKTCFPPKA